MNLVLKQLNATASNPAGLCRSRGKTVAAFTMVEIALCLGVIAVALVAIIGVLPTGVRVQRDNREDTVINQEGLLWLEAIRSGSRGLDYLTNFVDTITISNTTQGGATCYYNPAGLVPPTVANTVREPSLTNAQAITLLLTTSKLATLSGGNPVGDQGAIRQRGEF